ncbi:MAG: PilZ domain-containing protein [Planctomycetota bacterium]|jgi:hypothetical protein
MPDSSGSLVDRIIDIARGVAPHGYADRENRETTRVPYNGEVALVLITSSGGKTAPLIMYGEDISSGGICARSQEELPVGGCGGALMLRSDGEPVVLATRVVYCNSYGAMGFECGLEFQPQAPPVTLEDFRDKAGDWPDLTPARAA